MLNYQRVYHNFQGNVDKVLSWRCPKIGLLPNYPLKFRILKYHPAGYPAFGKLLSLANSDLHQNVSYPLGDLSRMVPLGVQLLSAQFTRFNTFIVFLNIFYIYMLLDCMPSSAFQERTYLFVAPFSMNPTFSTGRSQHIAPVAVPG